MKKIYLTFFIFLFSIAQAHSSLIRDFSSSYLFSEGDGLITHDSSTGLDWLDLSLTLGNSIIDTEKSSYFQYFRWATIAEVDNILISVKPDINQEDLSGLYINNAILFGSFFSNNNSGYEDVLSVWSQGVIAEAVATSGSNIFYPTGYVSYNSRDNRVYVGRSGELPDPYCCGTATESYRAPNRGSWLVRREAGDNPSDRPSGTIPEQNSLILMTLCLLWVFLKKAITT